LREAVRVEAALRQELLLCALLIPLACALPVTQVERVLLMAPLLLLLVVELLNSALEAVVDRISFEINDLSRRAKDFGSAAVFVCLLLVVLVWLFLGVPAVIQWFR
jgi:diacylglycerol kinase (ATP)